jgi:hypothetical protein
MARIELKNLIGNMTPEQIIFCSNFYAIFDGGTAAHRNIINVEPLTYFGKIAGVEFLNYAVTKMYLVLQLDVFPAAIINSQNYINFYDNGNNSQGAMYANKPVWHTTNAELQYILEVLYLKNFYFARFVQQGINEILFNGYRITLN